MAERPEPANNNHYNRMDEILQYISKNFSNLQTEDCFHANIVLNNAVQLIIDQMINLSSLFSLMYERPFYGGTYYAGLKIKRPDEFDICLKLRIPEIVNPVLLTDDNSGFVQIKVPHVDRLYNTNHPDLIRELNQMVDDENFMLQRKIIKWLYNLVCKALSMINMHNLGYQITSYYNGPTIRLNVYYFDHSFDIDFLIAFVFNEKYWPNSPFRSNEAFRKKTFLTVPKEPKLGGEQNRFFRFSFKEQENEFIKDTSDNGKLVFRLLRKLRNTQKHSTTSYILNTIFLWEVEKRDSDYWSQPLNVIFLDILDSYMKYMRQQNVPYFWNKRENMVCNMKQETTENIASSLERMIKTVKLYVEEDMYIFAKYLLTEDEYRQLTNHFLHTSCECSRNDEFYYNKVKASIYF